MRTARIVTLFALVLSASQGQVASAPKSSDEGKKIDPSVPLVAKDERAGGPSDETVKLSPFVVTGENVQRYLATETLAGTRVRTNLNDIAGGISVVTKEFLRDTASNNSQDLLVYTTNTEVGGLSGNFGGFGNGSSLFEASKFVAPNTNTRVRGLTAADTTRNYFTSNVPWDSYNTSSITISRGPNSTLFGLGSPAGIVNNSTNQAEFKDANRVEFTLGSYGSQRKVADFNKVILPGELAIRLEGLRDNTYYRQRPAQNQDQRYYAALRYEPKFLERKGMHTFLTMTYEDGSIHSNNPRILPPVDKLTPWFKAMNKLTIDNHNAPTSATEPWLDPGGIATGPRVIFSDPTSTIPANGYALEIVPTVYNGLNSAGAVDHNILGVGMAGDPNHLKLARIGAYWNYSLNAKLPFSTTLNPYKDIYISDPTIFNFYDRLMDGPNKQEFRRFDVATADLTQTFWNNKLGLQGVWSIEHYSDGYDGIFGSGGPGDTSISVDINRYLPDGSGNPNVGRPMVESFSGQGNVTFSQRKNARYTAFADISASDFLHDSWLTRALGRHKLTAAYTVDEYQNNSINFDHIGMDGVYLGLTGNTAATHNGLVAAGFVTYLGPSLAGASSAAGLNLSNLRAVQQYTVGKTKYWDSHWAQPINSSDPQYVNPGATWTAFDGSTSTQSENPANYTGWTTGNTGVTVTDVNNYFDRATAGTKNKLAVNSSVFVWQGFLFGDNVIPTWSVRQDDVKSYTIKAPRNPDNTYNVRSSDYRLSDTPTTVAKGTTHSWGIVAHTPKFIRKHLWENTDLALTYNDSSNFQVVAGRIDLEGNPVANPSGKTKEYGVTLSTWNDRLRLKINHYETSIENARLGGAYNEFVIGFAEYLMWTHANRLKLGLSGDPAYSVANSGYGFNLQPFPGVSDADTRAIQQKMVDETFSGLLSQKFFDTWKIDKTKSADWLTPIIIDFQAPSGTTATVRSLSQGMEYELDFQPTKNWAVTANVSHDTSKFNNVAENFKAIVNRIEGQMEGAPGQMNYIGNFGLPGVFWGPGAPVSIRALWNQYFYSPWKLILAQENTNLPEVRPWRLNVVTNYTFDGALKGWNAGGGYRWEDKIAIGYPVYHDTVTDADTFDVKHPYWGPKEAHLDLWVGYQRRLRPWLDWRIQLNVRDAGKRPSLVPISSQPDGSYSAMRILDGQEFRVTTSFSF
ncbi:MAG TPA: TonB-dependent receptor plug domain-containing protein [Lacunisphaera sp.]|nr:TonB-dependent receptor plug domain-containing protein [Lacunisphaera sp.]